MDTYKVIWIPQHGYAVLEIPTQTWASVHVYEQYSQARQITDELEDAVRIRRHWPKASDPDVEALMEDKNFLPIGVDNAHSPIYRLHQAAEAVARKRAGIESN